MLQTEPILQHSIQCTSVTAHKVDFDILCSFVQWLEHLKACSLSVLITIRLMPYYNLANQQLHQTVYFATNKSSTNVDYRTLLILQCIRTQTNE